MTRKMVAGCHSENSGLLFRKSLLKGNDKMLKKIILLMILALSVISFPTQAKAEEVYIGTSPATGRDCYIITQSIRWQNRRVVNLSLATYLQGKDPVYISYTFREYAQGRGVEFSNRHGFSGWIDKYETPIEYNTWVCVYNNYNPNNRR